MGEYRNVPVDRIRLFEGNPFRICKDEEFEMLVDSVKASGIYNPLLLVPCEGGMYEVISGQRRFEAAKEAGVTEVPAIVNEMNRDEAIIALVDSNIYREHILPSERAKAYKLKLDALSHRGKRMDLMTGGQDGHMSAGTKSRDVIAENAPDSARQIQRYIRLNNLEKPLLDMVDEGRIGLTPAVQLSYLKPEEQLAVADAINEMDATPNLSQAMRLRQYSSSSGLGITRARLVMAEAKANQHEYLKLSNEIRSFFPRDYSDRQISDYIVKLLSSQNTRKKSIER